MTNELAPHGRCAYELCKKPLPAPTGTVGRPRKYCDDEHCGARGRFLALIRNDARRAGVTELLAA